MRRRVGGTAALLASIALIACSTRTNRGSARVYVSFDSVPGTSVTSVQVTISGPGISPDIVAPLTKSAGAWTALIGGIPAGADLFTANAYDSTPTLRYTGSTTVNIAPDTVPGVLIFAEKVGGPGPVTNHAPVIDSILVTPINPTPGGTVTITAAAHDDDGPSDTLTFSWSPTGQFTPATGATTTWQAPTGNGLQSLTLTVTDLLGAYAADTFTLDVEPAPTTGAADAFVSLNSWPVVTAMKASPGQVAAGASTQLSTTATDADGDPLTFSWSASCAGAFSPAAAAQNPSFTPSAAGACILTVTVNDGRGGTNTGALTISVGPLPTPQLAPVIGSAFQSSPASFEGEGIQFQANAIDPNPGGSVSYHWAVDDGADSFSPNDSPTAGTTTLNVPANCNGTHIVTLTVTNAAALTTTQTFQFASCPTSCEQLLAAESPRNGPGSTSGTYFIDPAQNPFPATQDSTASSAPGTAPFLVYCDMNGPWTLVGKLGDTLQSKGSDFSTDLSVADLQGPANYGVGSTQYSHFDLHRFNAWGTTWTARTVLDTYQTDGTGNEHFQFTFWRPRLGTDPPATVAITCNPGCAGTNWGSSLAYQQLVMLGRSSTTGLANSNWITFGPWEGASSFWMFSYRVNALGNGVIQCLDGNGNTQLCHSPSGGLIDLDAIGAYTAAYGYNDNVQHSHHRPATYWLANRNSAGVP